MKRLLFLLFLLGCCMLAMSQNNDSIQVRKVIDRFFETLENQDSLAFRGLHMTGARFHIVGVRNDTVRTATRDVKDFTFRKKEVIRERMRDTGVIVKIHDRIAMVWAPYDLWVNEKFSHCGIDVFTLLKTDDGWKIASCSYSVEPKNCK